MEGREVPRGLPGCFHFLFSLMLVCSISAKEPTQQIASMNCCARVVFNCQRTRMNLTDWLINSILLKCLGFNNYIITKEY
jgi:uncharacterized membrane protein